MLRSVLPLALTVAGVACSSSSRPTTDDAGLRNAIAGTAGDGSAETGAETGATPTDGAVDGRACSGMVQPGTVLCTQVMSALCARRVSCKSAGCTCLDCADLGTEPCVMTCSASTPPCSLQSCTQAMATAPKGHDCTLAKFASQTSCDSVTSACINDLALVACSASQQDTWNWPASCNTFWARFPGPEDAGSLCNYSNYTQADYAGFADSGAYPNLPCGGCAPSSAQCSPNGSTAGHASVCWSDTGYPHPTYPAAGCITSGIRIGAGPNLWDVCCP